MSDVPANNPINVSDLDTEYPVPGQDNDSQGFRDNFTVINDNALAAKARLEDIEANGVRIDEDNTFTDKSTGGTAQLIRPTLKAQRELQYNVGNSTGLTTIDFNNGNYQTVTMTDEVTLTFTGEPDSGYYGRVLVHLTSAGDHNLIINPSITVKKESNSTSFFNGTTTILSGTIHLIEVYTWDSSVYYLKYLGEYVD